MTRSVQAGALVLVVMMILAGCALPFGADGDATPTPEPTPTPTPTPEPDDPYPPGVSETVLENSTELLTSHVETITESGYEATAEVNTTAERAGFLIEVESFARTTVEENASAYNEQRQALGGPVERSQSFWSNSSTEYIRVQENSEVSYEENETRHQGVLAGRPLIDPFVEGGNFTVEEVNETADPTETRLVATEIDDEEALEEGLPDGVQEIEWMNAEMIVDEDGRILSLEVEVGVVMAGENRIHAVDYAVTEIGDVEVQRPDWVDEAEEEAEPRD